MTKRLEILKNSLAKKEAIFDAKIQTHFDTVKQANGQPLNDKRNGHKTLAKWEQQNESIRTAQKEIEKTQRAIEREEYKIADCEAVLETLPGPIVEAIESGKITQWRKYPNRFFVPGGGKARIIWQKNQMFFSHLPERKSAEFEAFAAVYNDLKQKIA